MQRKSMSIRLSDAEQAALARAAAAEKRPPAMLARILVIEGLERRGHPPVDTAPAAGRARRKGQTSA